MAGWIPVEACLARATAQQTANANSTLHLFKDTLTPTGATTKADLVANEADFDDYAPITVTAWYDPILSPGGGYLITMPPQQFRQGATDPVTPNQIRGFYVLDAGGSLLYAGTFNADIPVEVAYAGVPVQVVDVFTTGFTS